MTRRNRDYRPVAGLVRSEQPWTYSDVFGSTIRCSPLTYKMETPWTAEARGLARHEMAHVAWSPLKHRRSRDKLIEKWAHTCEDARVNMLSSQAGLPVSLPLSIDLECLRQAYLSGPEDVSARVVRLACSLARSYSTYNEDVDGSVVAIRETLGSRDEGIVAHVLDELARSRGMPRDRVWSVVKRCAVWLAEYERWLHREAEKSAALSPGSIVSDEKIAASPAALDGADAPEKKPDSGFGVPLPRLYVVSDHAWHEPSTMSDLTARVRDMCDAVEHARTEAPRPRDIVPGTVYVAPATAGRVAVTATGTRKPSGVRFVSLPIERAPGIAGRMAMHYASLTQRVRGRGLHRVAVEGVLPTEWHRYASDGRVFRGPGGKARGTLLVDVSGSMSFTAIDLQRILVRNANRTVALYGASNGQGGTVSVVACGGRSVHPSRMLDAPGIGSGNVVDLSALRWLARQHQPLRWISDGVVTGVHDRANSETDAACRQVLRDSTIQRVPSLADLKWSRDSRPSLDVGMAKGSLRTGRVSP